MKRVLFEIAFNGENYHGWQIQDNATSIQEHITKSINIIIKSENVINIIGCGRTDKGVHAEKFYFHLDLPVNIDLNRLSYKINQILPSDILILNYKNVNEDFHARYDAVSRTYEYRITQKKEPFQNGLFNFIKHELDIQLLNESCKKLIQYKDFTSFSKVHTNVKNFNCNIIEAYWRQNGQQNIYTITSNRFLRNMVRAIVGTMLLVGQKKISLQDFCQIIELKDRSLAGPSVKAKGLFLVNVDY